MKGFILLLHIHMRKYASFCRSMFRPTAIMCTILALCSLFNACSSKKFLKNGEKTLSDVKISCDTRHFKINDLHNYIKQQPNAKWFTLFKVPLGIYCLSRKDSIKGNRGLSRIWRRIGQAPVIYDASLSQYSRQSIEQALNSQGYLHARCDTFLTIKGHKLKVNYHITPGARYYIQQFTQQFDSPAIRQAVMTDSAATFIHKGQPLNLNQLSEERSRIVSSLHNRGYYYINKDYVSFDIDTLIGSTGANVTLHVRMPVGVDSTRAYQPQHYRRVNIIMGDADAGWNTPVRDSISYRGLNFIYHAHNSINKRVFAAHVGIRPDTLYSEDMLQATYSNINSLPAISFTTMHVAPAANGVNDSLDCDIRLQPNKPHTLGLDVEGTNTSGDLGAAVALTYSNRNVFHGSEMLTLKLRGAYEAITGLEGYNNQNYTEWSAEANLRFPTLLLPFVDLDVKRRLKANSEAKIMYDTQDRPEFHRRVLTGAWAYTWRRTTHPEWQHRFDALSVNYVYMPWISDTFRRDYLEGEDPHYSVLRYSYENLFIVKTGYSFTYNSLRNAQNSPTGIYQTNGFQIKMGVELAGNLLYGLSKAFHGHRNNDGSYSLFSIAYSQYAKFDFDFAKSTVLNDRNSLAFHVAFGLGIPYGNSTILPYEKRYFAGGANSVRGWSVRGLGPGSYKGKDGKVDFVNQTGNMKLDLSVEWRTYLFWKLHGAFFIDAGNVWNTRAYADMDGSQFHFNTFYKQIALAYGLGLRLNFNYFILRFDGGMKAIDPSVPSGRLHYPISKPNLSRDFTFHFAVGLPF